MVKFAVFGSAFRALISNYGELLYWFYDITDVSVAMFLYFFRTYTPQSDLAVSKGRLFKIQVRLGGSVNYLFADWSAV